MDNHPEGHILIRRHLHPLFLYDVHDYIIERVRQWQIEQKQSNIYTDLR